MNKLFSLLVALLISSIAFSQARALRVENQTNCVQYYQIFGDDLCICGNKYLSALIAINPGNVHNYNTSIPLGGTYPINASKSIVGARIPNGPTLCQPTVGTIGEPPCGLALIYTYVAITQDCRPCAQTTARWFPATACGQARLIFTP
ncbi:hypothetical protein SF1_18980 [Sphingobacterium faecium NBRC 15299]|uniref:hypothetical protein n=1 Tax=Sphingobacterium faecium TaxID=34087 RepID=UPI000D366C4E|nr:hypothetical protein [Sphingobacterium faecium]PTX09458.1 hypothetical protein C8N37_10686 [Sphingobacterium faecium]GEM63916.1 hypothetical protein SF1_18980 [Sphingobacterium faecium NBRC 15299]